MSDLADTPALPPDGALLHRLGEENPFYAARARRHRALSAAILGIEATGDSGRHTLKYLAALRKQRDALLGEMIALVEAEARKGESARVETIWRAPAGATPGWRWG